MKPEHIASFLRSRGVTLNSGIHEAQLHRLADPMYRRVYAEFNGFPDGVIDGASGIRILPLAEVMATKGEATDESSRYIFADFLMGSDQYSFDLEDHRQPIRSVEDGTEISPSWPAFWRSFLEGEFDFQ